jgi:hypothetical protein
MDTLRYWLTLALSVLSCGNMQRHHEKRGSEVLFLQEAKQQHKNAKKKTEVLNLVALL